MQPSRLRQHDRTGQQLPAHVVEQQLLICLNSPAPGEGAIDAAQKDRFVAAGKQRLLARPVVERAAVRPQVLLLHNERHHQRGDDDDSRRCARDESSAPPAAAEPAQRPQAGQTPRGLIRQVGENRRHRYHPRYLPERLGRHHFRQRCRQQREEEERQRAERQRRDELVSHVSAR